MIDIRIEAKEGYNAVMEDNIFVILNNELSKELLDEGIAREIVSKVQQMRKNNDYDILDRINIIYNSNELKEIIEKYSDFIKTETLCNEFIEDSTLLKEYDLNSVTAGLKVEKNL